MDDGWYSKLGGGSIKTAKIQIQTDNPGYNNLTKNKINKTKPGSMLSGTDDGPNPA